MFGRCRRASFFLFGALLSLTGCGASNTLVGSRAEALRIRDPDFDRDPRSVSAVEALADLDTAVFAFGQAYAAVDGRPPTPKPERIEAARARIRARTAWSPPDLAHELVELFRTPDGHLSFGYGNVDVPVWPERAPVASRPWLDHRDPSFLVKVSSPSRDGEPLSRPIVETPVNHGQLRVLASSRDGFGSGGAVDLAVATAPSDVSVLTIRTFDSAARAELATLPAIASRLRRERAFVVDLRGNGGGNYTFAERFVLALTDASLQRLDEREVMSVAAAEGRANSARRRLARGEVPASAEGLFRSHLEALSREAVALRAAGAAGRDERVLRGSFVKGTAKGPLRSRVVLLVDHNCASACEMMIALARQIPNVVLAGENTRGGMAVGELALFMLPNSGITVTLGTRAFNDPRGGFAETRGFLPDVWLDASDPLVGAMELAASGAHVRVARRE